MTALWKALTGMALLAAAGCSSSGGESLSFGERLMLAGTTVPPSMADEDRDVFCPPVDVALGGATIQSGGGEGSPRSVVSLGQLARECIGRADGSTVVNVGVEGRAVTAAGGGRFDVPVQIVVKSNGNVIANRARRAVAGADGQGTFALVEEGIVVPPSAAGDFSIEVGLGSGSAARPRRG